jgi:hypothetical protein
VTTWIESSNAEAMPTKTTSIKATPTTVSRSVTPREVRELSALSFELSGKMLRIFDFMYSSESSKLAAESYYY